MQNIMCAVFATFGICAGNVVEMPVYTRWTVYSAEKNWNEAQLVCELSGGHLAILNTTHRDSVFEVLLTREPWKSAVSYGVSVGLLNLQDQAQDPRYWSPGCQPNTVPLTFSILPYHGGCVSKGASKAYRITCDKSNEYACERRWDIPCPYKVVQGRKPNANYTFTVQMASSDQVCQMHCHQGGINCWAAAYMANNGKCRLYDVTSPFSFDNIMETTMVDSKYTMYIKQCYEALEDKKQFPWIQAQTILPVSVCNANDTGRVYTFVKEKMSWSEAQVHCNQIGQTLAGSLIDTDRALLHDLVIEFYEATYSVSARNPHWVNLQNPDWPTLRTVWVDTGNPLISSVTVNTTLGGPKCGAVHVETGHYSLHDCHHLRSFICVKDKVPCMSVKIEDIVATNVQDMGALNLSTCQSTCQNHAICQAFSYKPRKYPSKENCRLSHTAFSGFFPPYVADTSYTLYRETCVWAILQEEMLINETMEISGIGESTTSIESTIVTTVEPTTPTTPASTTTETTADTDTTPSEDTTPPAAASTTTSNMETTPSPSPSTTTTTTTATTTTMATTTTITTETTKAAAATTSTTTPATTSSPTSSSSSSSPTTTAGSSSSSSTTTTTTAESSSSSSPLPPPSSTTTTTESTADPQASTSPTTTTTTCCTPTPTPTTATTTTTTTNNNNGLPPRPCACRCMKALNPQSLKTLNDTQKKLVEELTIPPNSTFRNRIRYYSLPDRRPLATGMGVTAIVFVTAVLLTMVGSDLSRLFAYCRERELQSAR